MNCLHHCGTDLPPPLTKEMPKTPGKSHEILQNLARSWLWPHSFHVRTCKGSWETHRGTQQCCALFKFLTVKLKRFKAINFRWNPADRTRVSKEKKLASPADVTSTLGLRSPFTRPWTRRCQLQTFIYWRGFDGFPQFFLNLHQIMYSFGKEREKSWGEGAL